MNRGVFQQRDGKYKKESNGTARNKKQGNRDEEFCR